MLRLDRALGEFLAEVQRETNGNAIVVLTSDHGVMSNPEYLVESKHIAARRIQYDQVIRPQINALDMALRNEWGINEQIIRTGNISIGNYVNYAAVGRAGVSKVELERRVRDGLRRIDSIEDVYFRGELEGGDGAPRPYLRQYQLSYYAPRGEDFRIRFCENCLVTSEPIAADHDSPYRYDTHVPLVFWGMGIRCHRIDGIVHTVDIAPTLGRILGLALPQEVDGRPLPDVLRRTPASDRPPATKLTWIDQLPGLDSEQQLCRKLY